jgi:hypothetical protein
MYNRPGFPTTREAQEIYNQWCDVSLRCMRCRMTDGGDGEHAPGGGTVAGLRDDERCTMGIMTGSIGLSVGDGICRDGQVPWSG